MIAEDQCVAVEAKSSGLLHNGRNYNSSYHLRFEFRGDLVCSVREYMDTMHTYETFVAS